MLGSRVKGSKDGLCPRGNSVGVAVNAFSQNIGNRHRPILHRPADHCVPLPSRDSFGPINGVADSLANLTIVARPAI